MFGLRFQQLILMLPLALGVGCSDSEPGMGEDPSIRGSIAALQVERLTGVRGLEDHGSATLTAAFAHFRGLEGEQVGKLLGTALPTSDAEPCAWLDDALSESALGDAAIELLDAGSIRVHLADAQAELVPTTFPELGGLAAGVFYAEDVAWGAADRSRVRFEISGQREIRPFVVSIAAPAEPTALYLAGRPWDSEPVLRRGEDVEVRWEPGLAHDTMEIELGTRGEILRCTAPDSGRLVIPGAAIDALGGAGSLNFTARRVRVQSFEVEGFDLAFVRATASHTFDVTVE